MLIKKNMEVRMIILEEKNGNGVNLSPKDMNNIDDCLEIMNEKKVEKISVSKDFLEWRDQKDIDLSFMSRLKFPLEIKELMLSDCYNAHYLYAFKNLKDLGFTLPHNEELDLCNFQELKSLSASNLCRYNVVSNEKLQYLRLHGKEGILDYDKIVQFHNLLDLRVDYALPFDFEKIISLKELQNIVLKYGKIVNFKNIAKLEKLDFLWLLFNRTLTSLEGISQNKTIKNIMLDGCSKLIDLSEIGEIEQLESLMLESMKNRDFSFIKKLKNLKKLSLCNCGEIDSVKFVEEMPNLKSVIILETNIKDGDLTPLKNLNYANIDDKRHYNMKSSELPTEDALHYGYFADSDKM